MIYELRINMYFIMNTIFLGFKKPLCVYKNNVVLYSGSLRSNSCETNVTKKTEKQKQ